MTGEPRALLGGRWRDRPVLVVGLAAAAVAVGHAIWSWGHRVPGAYNVDEAAFLGDAVRFHRAFLHPTQLPNAVLATGVRAPLVTFLGGVLLLFGPLDPRVAMLVQPLLLVAAAIGVAAIANRLAGPRPAVVAGLAFVVLPTTVGAARSMWLGLGLTVAVLVAVWGLVASEHGTAWPVWVYGVGLGAVPLSRSMGVAFVPILVVAALLLVWDEPAGRRRVLRASALGVVLCLPFLVGCGQELWGYLTSSAYGATNRELFRDDPLLRPVHRLALLAGSVGLPVLVSAAVAVALGLRARLRSGGRLGPIRGRAAWTPAVVVIGGFAVLLTTSNSGDWFDLPLIALAATSAAVASRWAPAPARAAVVVSVAAVGMMSLGVGWWLVSPDAPGATVMGRFRLGVDEVWAAEDPRFDVARRSDRAAAAAEWNELVAEVGRWRDRWAERPGRERIDLLGGAGLLNIKAFELDDELHDRQLRLHPVDVRDHPCGVPTTTRLAVLVPLGEVEDVAPRDRAQADARWARRHCWREVARFPMPARGDLIVLERAGGSSG